MIKSILSICLTLTCTALCFGQYLLSAELIDQMTKQEVEVYIEGETSVPVSVRNGVHLYKALYMTTGTDGLVDTASGLIVLPDNLEPNHPIVAYQHGTTNGPESVPSLLTAGHELPVVYGAMGYVVSAADYLGLGESRGFHPYVHAPTEASAGLDMLVSTVELVEDSTGGSWVGHLFISGYSQGGHGAAALQKELEANWALILPVTASTPMSGPYDMTGVMYNRIISNQAYLFASYIPYAVLGHWEMNPDLFDEISDIFKPNYVEQITRFHEGDIGLGDLNTFLVTRLFFDAGLSIPSQMFRDSVLQELRNNPDNTMKAALQESSLVDWVPQAPTRLLYCTADDQVPYRNSIVADSMMNANGAPDVMAMDMLSTADHGECVPPAVLESIAFFDSFILSSTDDPRNKVKPLAVFPNPASDVLHLDVTGIEAMHSVLSIYSITGQLVVQRKGQIAEFESIPLTGFQRGIYLVELATEAGRFAQKFSIH